MPALQAATTLMSGCARKIPATPSSTTGWSSATTTEIRFSQVWLEVTFFNYLSNHNLTSPGFPSHEASGCDVMANTNRPIARHLFVR